MNSLPKPKPPYKTEQNKWFTAQLFYDRWVEYPIELRLIQPVFSLHEDKPGLINARATFVALDDPTGYLWAVKYLGDYNHWKELMKAKWFRDAYIQWREELELKLQTQGLLVMKELAENGNPQAAKFLANKEWNKNTSGRGRPSKVEIQGALREEVRKATVEDEDMVRIGLVKG